MATIPEQLAAAPVTDALNGTREETIWPKLAWAGTSRGTFSTTGWNPSSGFTKLEPHETRDGAWFKTTKLTGGNAFVHLSLSSTTFTMVNATNGAGNPRTDGLWLFSTGEGTANGYQMLCVQNSESATVPYNWILKLYKYTAGTGSLIAESGVVTVNPNGAFGLARLNGKVGMWFRQEGASAFVAAGSEVTDATYTEGFSGIQGNGSNPRFVNFTTGLLTPESLLHVGKRKMLMGVG